ncbi:MAG: hypothetical protein JXA41_15990 [Deltaproteobacteria bacterium]|nr:hypothetical protein [Deltaproteobacteria bacterium]
MNTTWYKKRRIGLKYCGGCNPRHDRVQTAALIKKSLKEEMEFVSHEEAEIEGVLIIAGCPTACVDRTPFAGRPVWIVTGPDDADRFIEQIKGD